MLIRVQNLLESLNAIFYQTKLFFSLTEPVNFIRNNVKQSLEENDNLEENTPSVI